MKEVKEYEYLDFEEEENHHQENNHHQESIHHQVEYQELERHLLVRHSYSLLVTQHDGKILLKR